MVVDYSRWKDIEISDDEDDTHPNIDTPSLNRWRHEARIERMHEKEMKKDQMLQEQKAYEQKVKTVKSKLKGTEPSDDLQKELASLELQGDKLKEKFKEFQKAEKSEPWNVDTISKDGFTKTVINKPLKTDTEELTDDQKEDKMRKFIKENEKKLKEFGMFRHYEDSRKYMMEHSLLACEETANYLVIWCINLQMEEKHELMTHVAHQTICVQFILELAKQLERDPRSCVSAFFHRIQQAEPEYKKAFNDELDAFIERVKKRGEEKIKEAMKEIEEEEKQKRLGPGGLDPLEVLEELPEELRSCFESQNIELLKETIAQMEQEDAAKYMKQCVDSGLWVPEPSKE